MVFLEEAETRLTTTEEAVGARNFMAPELEDGRLDNITAKCDTYSLGKLLYWLLAGRIFSREKHRDPTWDLKGRNPDSLTGWNNIYLEHINRLLDLMIVADPSKRREVDNILIISKRILRAVEKEFTPIAPDINQPCTYCGYGIYVLKADSSVEAQNFGYNARGSPNWRIYVCNECGHVQAFRLDYAAEQGWWKS